MYQLYVVTRDTVTSARPASHVHVISFTDLSDAEAAYQNLIAPGTLHLNFKVSVIKLYQES